MITSILTLFIIFINFINFLKYIIVTQKLIIVIIEIIKDLGYTMFIAIVMVTALSFAMYGIELYKYSYLNMAELESLDPGTDYSLLTFVDIFIKTCSLAFLANSSTIDSFKNITALLNHSDIDN